MADALAAQNLCTVRSKDLPITQHLATYGQPNVPRELLDEGILYIIVHETANENPTAGGQMHARFVVELEGGSANVSFHFTVDKFGAWQMVPLDNVTYQAADGLDNRVTDIGGFRGISIETCVNDPIGSPGWLQTKRNLVALITAIMTGDSRIQYAGRKPSEFSSVRILPHIAVSDPSPDQHHCPDRMINEGLIDARTGAGILRDAVALSIGIETQTVPEKPRYAPVVDLPFDLATATGVQELNGLKCLMMTLEAEALKTVVPRAYAGDRPPASGPTLPVRSKVIVKAVFKDGKNRQWFILRDGSRVRATSFNPAVTWRMR